MKKFNVKSTPAIQEVPLKYLEIVSKVIAFAVCICLLIIACLIIFNTISAIFSRDISDAIQDGLSVLILLEMFYVTRSFVRYGSINVSIVVNVGIIAAIKEMIFALDSISLQSAIAFGVIFLTLGITYFMEKAYYEKMVKNSEK